MFRIKIVGAGSIGNHIAHAAVSRGWQVTLTDIDPAALERTRSSTYPGRYGAWNDAILLKDSRAALGDKADVGVHRHAARHPYRPCQCRA